MKIKSKIKTEEIVFTKKQLLNFADYVRDGLSMNDWASQESKDHFNDWQTKYKMKWNFND